MLLSSFKHTNTPAASFLSYLKGHNFTPLPEILFGQSFLELSHPATGFILRFNTTGALVLWAQRHLDPNLEIVKVPEASQWAAHLGPEATAAGLKQACVLKYV